MTTHNVYYRLNIAKQPAVNDAVIPKKKKEKGSKELIRFFKSKVPWRG